VVLFAAPSFIPAVLFACSNASEPVPVTEPATDAGVREPTKLISSARNMKLR
jgi:hypothetical protein